MSQGSSQVFGLSTWTVGFPLVALEKNRWRRIFLCFLCQSLVDRASPFSVFGTLGWEAWLGTLREIGGVGEGSKCCNSHLLKNAHLPSPLVKP